MEEAGSSPDEPASILMSRRGRHSPGRHLGKSTPRRRFHALVSLVLSGLVALALVVIGVPLASESEWRTVVTGSMEPAYRVGDVVLVSSVGVPASIGDVVAFQDPLRPDRDVLHRIVATDEVGRLLTKGDANGAVDPWTIDPSAVIGTSTLRMPKLGFLVEAVSSDLGILVFLALPAAILLVSEGKVWYRFVRYGSEVFETAKPGRHLPPRGRHLTEGAT